MLKEFDLNTIWFYIYFNNFLTNDLGRLSSKITYKNL